VLERRKNIAKDGVEMLEVKDVSKVVDNKAILKGINMKVYEDAITVILGPTGSGKTTLLRIIAGVEEPTSGRIFLDGKDITDLAPKDRNVAIVFQEYCLYPHLTAYENIASPLRAAKIGEKEIEERVKRVAATLGITDILGKLPRETSGGQRQRIAIARALVKDAKVCMLDEPLTNLDYKIRETMREEIREIFKRTKGKIIIYSTPDPLDALLLADYTCVMRNGVIEQMGKNKEVYNKPKNLFVAKYYSYPPMNVIIGQIEKLNGKAMLKTPWFKMSIEGWSGPLNKDVAVGFRCEQLEIVPAGSKVDMKLPSDKLKVATVHRIGTEHLIQLWTADKNILYALTPGDVRLEVNETVDVLFHIDKLWLFDKETEEFLGRIYEGSAIHD
jgi:ABC-type sugar transport system ATPase subunit